MCGIAGALSCTHQDLTSHVRAMIDAQRHRGPDDGGEWADGVCALGHRRLAILDLSVAGRQPLANEDGTVRITFNGEIYNFKALRHELEGLGHQFRTRTDTEVIVHAYEQWGADCPRRLRGMFAFGLWDQRRRRLFLARDRVGKKPLFYTRQGDRFLFASELQGLLACPDVPRAVDLGAIDAYLSWGYVPPPRTAFQGIFKLPPAHWLTLDLSPEGPVLAVERYWSLAYEPKLRVPEAEACEALHEKLTEAVRLRLVSDVPLGAFLSGGIDSSVVVGLMAGLTDRPVKTFSIGFDDAAYNELEHARRVADRWGTDHHEFVVRPDALAILPRLVRHCGEPYADSSAVPTFYLSQLTRCEVTVALNGDGGDESFAGYDRYRASRVAEQMRRFPGSGQVGQFAARALPNSIHVKHPLHRARRFLLAAHRPLAQRYASWVTCFGEAMKASFYTSEMHARLGEQQPVGWLEALFAGASDLDPVDAAMAVDIQSYLPHDLLVKVDITSMANSLEARSPFLDHEVMELAARLPAHLKLRRGQAKYLLKRAFADLLPRENFRRRKMGFGVPVGQWFRGPLRELLCDTLLSEQSLSRGYFRPRSVQCLVREHLDRQSDHSFPLWSLLMLELWHREMVDQAPEPVTAAPFAVDRREP
jgi:asparagine synthase (glutamine-hydrolysing)